MSDETHQGHDYLVLPNGTPCDLGPSGERSGVVLPSWVRIVHTARRGDDRYLFAAFDWKRMLLRPRFWRAFFPVLVGEFREGRFQARVQKAWREWRAS